MKATFLVIRIKACNSHNKIHVNFECIQMSQKRILQAKKTNKAHKKTSDRFDEWMVLNCRLMLMGMQMRSNRFLRNTHTHTHMYDERFEAFAEVRIEVEVV